MIHRVASGGSLRGHMLLHFVMAKYSITLQALSSTELHKQLDSVPIAQPSIACLVASSSWGWLSASSFVLSVFGM